MTDAIRDERGRFLAPPPNVAITTHNARELQRRSVESRIEKSREAVREAFRRGEDIPWSKGYLRAAEALVSVIFDDDSKEADKVRAFAELRRAAGFSQLDKQQPVHATQHNYFRDGEAAKQYLDAAAAARCPECGEIREYGVAHACYRDEDGAQSGTVIQAQARDVGAGAGAGDVRGTGAAGGSEARESDGGE